MNPWHVKIPFSSCVTKCAMINQNAELENARFLIFFLISFKLNSETADSENLFAFFHSFFVCCIFFLWPSHARWLIEATCSLALHIPQGNLVSVAELKQQRIAAQEIDA